MGEEIHVRPVTALRGRVRVPGDKSISHRVVMLAALAEGESVVRGWLCAGDTLATREAMRALGVSIETFAISKDLKGLRIVGRGLRGLHPPPGPIDCHRSGTTMRLLAGILAGQPFPSVLDGSPQLRRRPMRRVVEPLRRMGARITDTDGHAPLYINSPPRVGEGPRKGANSPAASLRGIAYNLPVPSAQVKSALLLAGLYATGPTVVREPAPARDHTERMLQAQGAHLRIQGDTIILEPPSRLHPLDLTVPGDFSSAAFLIVAGLLVPEAEVVIEGVGVNPRRIGLLDVLEQMGARVWLSHRREISGEPVADLRVRTSTLHGVTVEGEVVVRMIDEFPILAVAATQAEGVTLVRGAAELRAKESDRIATTVAELRKMGADIVERPDGFLVRGPTPLHGAVVSSHGDHRLGMALVVAGLIAAGETVVQDTDCIADSFPGFEGTLGHILEGLNFQPARLGSV